MAAINARLPAAAGRSASAMTAWTILLLGLASIAVELLIGLDLALPAQVWLRGADLAPVAVSLGIFWWRGRRSAEERAWPTPREQALLLLLFLWPFLLATLRQVLMGSGGWLLELMLLAGLRNLAWGLLATRWEQRERTAAAISLPLTLAVVLLSEHRLTPLVVCLYLVVGCNWLMQWYWQHLPLSGDTGRRPGRRFLLILLLVAACLGSAFATHGRTTRALWGWLPSSGGTRWSDPDSRAGVGDGDDEARSRQTAQSVGFSESDLYIDTEDPSLYDVVGDLFGEPRKMREVERALALPLDKTRRRDIIPSENLRPGREFQLLREPVPSPRPDQREADALLYVQGPAPAHLALVAYDWFDGVAWKEEPYSPLAMGLKNNADDPWMEFIYPLQDPPPFFMLPVRHTVKIVKLKGSHLPTPAHLRGFRVGKLNEPSFFAWAQPGIVRLADRNVPKATIFEVETGSVDYASLADYLHQRRSALSLRNYLALPGAAACQQLLDDLAEQWTRGLPAGWPQIAAVISRLREIYVLDPSWREPAEVTDAVGYFLTHSRRGRDFHFASAAALLLRSLGYPARLVSGFYVNPERWNEKTGHYHLMREDWHFWPELLVDGRFWIPLEPTPGYELMPARLTWWAWSWRLLMFAWQWAESHPLTVAGSLSLLALAFYLRRRFLDQILTLWCHWQLGRAAARRHPRQAITATLWLLEWRGRAAGLSRPAGVSIQRWYAAVAAELPMAADWVRTFVRWTNWALYAPDNVPAEADASAVVRLCRQLVAAWRFRPLRRVARQRGRGPASSPLPTTDASHVLTPRLTGCG